MKEQKKVEIKRALNMTPEAAFTLRFFDNKDFFEQYIGRLNCRACLYKGESRGRAARSEITGMLTVLNALGYEAVGDWDRFNSDFDLVPAAEIAAAQGVDE